MKRPFAPLLNVLALVVCLSAALPAAAAEDDVRIAGGIRGRTYNDVYAVNLGSLLKAFRVRYLQTQGSVENLDLLVAGRAEVGFAQVDIFAARMQSDPKRFSRLGVIGRLADECVYIAYRKNGPVQNVSALKASVESEDRKPVLSVGEAEGGMHGTWSFVNRLEPAYGATTIKLTPGTLAINHLATGMLDAVAWVTDPTNLEHKLLRAVKANSELGIFGLDDPALVYSLPEGAPVYNLRTIRVISGRGAGKITTVCTSSGIFTRPGAPPEVIQAISDILSLQREKLVHRRGR